MTSYRIFLVAIFVVNCALCAVSKKNEPLLFDKLRKVGLKSSRLSFENFKKDVFTVPGYSGRESASPNDPPFNPTPECGDQFLNLTAGAFGSVTSPSYPEKYLPKLECEWIIESIPGTVVEATFFDVKTQPWLFAFSDYVMVSINGEWLEYRRFAGDSNSKMPFTFVSKENRLAIRFVSSAWLNFRGFKMAYVVRPVKPSDELLPYNEFGSAFNNDLVAVCSSKPIGIDRINNKSPKEGTGLIQRRVDANGKTIRIVNGVETMPHQYPFVVAILADESFFCTGSLIDDVHILTTAQCVNNANRIDLFFGVYNMTNRAENWYARQVRSLQLHDISSSVFVHPNYDEDSGAHDIAVLRVEKVKITKYVQPIFLPSVYSLSNSFTGWNLKTVGWGSTEQGMTKDELKITPVLRQASATVISSSECRNTFQGAITGNNMCTRNAVAKLLDETTTSSTNETEEEPSDSVTVDELEFESPCHGDGGGPLFAEFAEDQNANGEMGGLNLNQAGSSSHECVNAKANGGGASDSAKHQDTACQRPKDSNQKWYVQVGVLSFGSFVCGQEIPVAYTRVTAYLQWIAYITGRHG